MVMGTKMAKRFAAIVIIFNAIMGFFLFLSNQLMLLNLKGFIVQQIDISAIGIRAYQPASSSPAPIIDTVPISNLPFYAFLFSLVVNVCFLILLLREKETKQPSS